MYKVLFLFLIVACKPGLEDIKKEADVRSQQQFDQLSVDEVDEYPLFESCNPVNNTKDCFYDQLYTLLHQRLNGVSEQLVIEKRLLLEIKITVPADGQIFAEHITAKKGDTLFEEQKEVLRHLLIDLPKIQSAIKQAVPVKSSYLCQVALIPKLSE